MLALVLSLAVSAEAGEKFGRVVLALGNVTAQKGSETARALRAGDTVYRGERVVTDEEGRAKLLLEDRSVVSLAPKTEMELTGLRSQETPRTTVKLAFGRLWANVQKLVGGEAKFDVVTANAVAGVRGTSFIAEANKDKSTFSVANGSVTITGGGQTQLLETFQQINATGTGLNGFLTLPPGALQDIIAGLSASGGLNEKDRLARLEQLERQVAPATAANGDAFFTGVQNQTPPVNLDPQQTTQTTLIRGHVEVVQP